MLSRDTVYATYFDRRIRISTPHVSMGTSGARACMSGIIELGDVHMPTILKSNKKLIVVGSVNIPTSPVVIDNQEIWVTCRLMDAHQALVGFLLRCDGGLIFFGRRGHLYHVQHTSIVGWRLLFRYMLLTKTSLFTLD